MMQTNTRLIVPVSNYCVCIAVQVHIPSNQTTTSKVPTANSPWPDVHRSRIVYMGLVPVGLPVKDVNVCPDADLLHDVVSGLVVPHYCTPTDCTEIGVTYMLKYNVQHFIHMHTLYDSCRMKAYKVVADFAACSRPPYQRVILMAQRRGGAVAQSSLQSTATGGCTCSHEHNSVRSCLQC